MTEKPSAIELIIEFDKIQKPVYFVGFEKDIVISALDRMGIVYKLTHIKYHGDGSSGVYDDTGRRTHDTESDI